MLSHLPEPFKQTIRTWLKTTPAKSLMRLVLQPVRPLVRRGHLPILRENIHVFGNFSVRMPGGQMLRLIGSEDNGLYFEGFPAGYEPEATLPWFLHASQSRTILDVGAHLGLYSLFASFASRDSRIFAFEPVELCAAGCEKNLVANSITNVTLVRAAASDRTGTDIIYVPRTVSEGRTSRTATLSAGAMDQRQDPVECRHLRLDDFVREQGLRVDLIKVDVEGCNARVLEGSVDVLASQSPVLYMEFLPLDGSPQAIREERRTDTAAAERLLDEAGYRHKYLAMPEGLSRRPDVRNHTDRHMWNWCLSKEPLDERFESRTAMFQQFRARE